VVEDYPAIADRSSVVGIGVDVDAVREAEPYERERPVVLMVGRLEAYKQVDLAVEAFGSVNVPSDLVIIGSGPERERISERISGLGLDERVRMLGYLDDEETRRWQRTATVVLSMSRSEAFGLGLAEAVVAGARVVASDIPAHREVSAISGGEFSFVSAGTDRDEVAAALSGALRSGHGEDGHWTIPSWDIVAQRIAEHYFAAISAA
jgi:glycosyltransferase involved in cell wall biosynthesis